MNGSLHYALLCFVEYPFPDKGTDVPYLSIQSFVESAFINHTFISLYIYYQSIFYCHLLCVLTENCKKRQSVYG